MNPLMEQLHDIEGIDSISWWPLAIGWWILIACFALVLAGIGIYFYRRYLFKNSWRQHVLDQLKAMEERLTDETSREIAISLSQFIRRIAIQKNSRKECAGLIGEDWLLWLTNNDPGKFDWKGKGGLLIEAPYSPKNAKLPKEQVIAFLHAIKRWVD